MIFFSLSTIKFIKIEVYNYDMVNITKKRSDGKVITFYDRRKNGKSEGFGWHTLEGKKELEKQGFKFISVQKPKK